MRALRHGRSLEALTEDAVLPKLAFETTGRELVFPLFERYWLGLPSNRLSRRAGLLTTCAGSGHNSQWVGQQSWGTQSSGRVCKRCLKLGVRIFTTPLARLKSASFPFSRHPREQCRRQAASVGVGLVRGPEAFSSAVL